jgi:hypothetical protein
VSTTEVLDEVFDDHTESASEEVSRFAATEDDNPENHMSNQEVR